MLELTDSHWLEFPSNYGSGTRVAELLAEATAGAPMDGWHEELFQSLLHQYTVSPAAYPALPHLVAIAEARPETRLELLVLVGGCVAYAEEENAAQIPAPILEAWHDARRRALPLILNLLEDENLNDNEIRYLLSALAAVKGQAWLSRFIEAADVEIVCPNCGQIIQRYF